MTLDNYVERIHEAIDRAPGPVVVVAHSRGGLAATQAAEGRHEQINTLVYLAALVSPALQKRMYTATPCEEVRSIEASHSAYFSKPDELTAHLDAIAARAPSPAVA